MAEPVEKTPFELSPPAATGGPEENPNGPREIASPVRFGPAKGKDFRPQRADAPEPAPKVSSAPESVSASPSVTGLEDLSEENPEKIAPSSTVEKDSSTPPESS